MTLIYRKTAKAQAEIDTRAHRLVPRLRTALILVDGRRTDDELRRMIAVQPEETLATLLEQGFIEVASEVAGEPARPRAVAPAAAASPVAAAAPAAPTLPPGKPFEQVRREAVRALTDVVGPMGEALAIKMEKARSAAELRPLLDVACRIIANSRGNAAAEQFAARFIGMPAAA